MVVCSWTLRLNFYFLYRCLCVISFSQLSSSHKKRMNLIRSMYNCTNCSQTIDSFFFFILIFIILLKLWFVKCTRFAIFISFFYIHHIYIIRLRMTVESKRISGLVWTIVNPIWIMQSDRMMSAICIYYTITDTALTYLYHIYIYSWISIFNSNKICW